MVEYLATHWPQIALGFTIFIVSLVVSSAVSIFVIVRLHEHYFIADDFTTFAAHRPQWQRTLGMIAKNILGAGLVILGLVMALPGVPGQGLLTMFIGIVLLDVPGKRALERRVIARPAILRACNRLRARFGKKPFALERE